MVRPKKDKKINELHFKANGEVLEIDLTKEESGEGRHPTNYYKLGSIKRGKKGEKIITLKPTKQMGERKSLIDEITTKVEKNVKKSDIIKDMLNEYKTDVLKDVKKMIKEGAPVRTRDGCLKLIIGKGKKKHTLDLRK